MKQCIIDHPVYVSYENYHKAINRMVEYLKKISGVVSIYQIGSISSPGISDIDMIVVFMDGVRCNINPHNNLNKNERYLFTHGLFGTSEKFFAEAQKYTFFHNYKCLWGKENICTVNLLDNGSVKAIKIQIALEYLIKMYISLTIERTYGIYKLRSLLLQTKALLYDFEFLGRKNEKIVELVNVIVEWRNFWFSDKISNDQMNIWKVAFYKELFDFLKNLFLKESFYLTQKENTIPIARNIFIKNSKHFNYSHSGFVLPSYLGVIGRKYFNIQNKFNKFHFYVPFKSEPIPTQLNEYFYYRQSIKKYNKKYLPCFQTLSSSLNV